MKRERSPQNLHYSDTGGHYVRGQYWKEIKKEQRRVIKREKDSPGEQFVPAIYSPLVGVDVLIFELRK